MQQQDSRDSNNSQSSIGAGAILDAQARVMIVATVA